MAPSRMLPHVALVRTDVSEELSPTLIHHFVFHRSVCRLLITTNVPSSPILVTPMMEEALSSSETSVLTRVTRRNMPEDAFLHSHCHENLKSYNTIIVSEECRLLGCDAAQLL
jgi:hypothetical protein